MTAAANARASLRGRVVAALRGDAGVVLGYLALAALLLQDSLRPGRVFSFRDVYLFWMPSIEGFVRSAGRGELPLWDPVFDFGKPLLADPGLQLAYPPTWLNLLMLPATYYRLFLLGHLAWGGWGACRLARRWGLKEPAAWSAGAFFVCSGPVVSALSLWHHFAGTTWLPWVLVALEGLLERPSGRRAALLGAAAAGQALAGSADLCLMTAGLCGLRALAEWRRTRLGPLLAWSALAGVLAAGLAAVQWIPALATLGTSTRAGFSSEVTSYWSLHPAQLVELLFPLPTTGFALLPEIRQRLFEGRESFIASLHPGIGVLGLAALGLCVPGPRRRLRAGLWIALALVVVAALGRHALLYPLIGALPGFDHIRYPQKFLLPASLFLAAAAACGTAVWLEPWSTRQQRAARRVAGVTTLAVLALGTAATALWARPTLLASVVVEDLVTGAAAVAAPALAIGALTALLFALLLMARSARVEPTRTLTIALLGLSLAQLVYASGKLCQGAPEALVARRPTLLGPLLREPRPQRLQVIAPPVGWIDGHMARSPSGWSSPDAQALGRAELLQAPTPARWGVDGAYWGTFTGQEPLVFSNLTSLVNQRRDAVGTRLLRMGGVTHLATIEESPYPELQEVAALDTLFDVPVRLLRLPGSSPRAFAVDGVAVADEPASYALVQDPAFDHRTTAILPDGTPRAPDPDFRGNVRVLWRRTASVGLRADLSGEGILVLLEAWDPGWTVEVDGTVRPLLRADLIFRGVALERGSHRVVFRYRPRGVVVGLWVSLGALALALPMFWRR